MRYHVAFKGTHHQHQCIADTDLGWDLRFQVGRIGGIGGHATPIEVIDFGRHDLLGFVDGGQCLKAIIRHADQCAMGTMAEVGRLSRGGGE